MNKSLYKIKPRFNVGDWVIFTTSGNLYQVEKKENCEYTLKDIHGGSFCVSFSNEELVREWTIQDAKDGDVLIDKSHIGECVFIFKEARASDIKTDVNNPLAIIGYCGINHIGFTSRLSGLGFGDTVNCTYYPATKEQRDSLMKAMKESGYEWDADKKELKKLVEPKFKVGDKIVNVPMKYWGASITQGTISKITEDKYIFTDGSRMSISSQDSWELVSDKKPKFDPKTLQPFDRVLARDYDTCKWKVDFYSHKEEGNRFPYICIGNNLYKQCIPYNDDTKHLVGTNKEAPEYYRYWES